MTSETFADTANAEIMVAQSRQLPSTWAVLRGGKPFAWFADKKDAEQFADKARFPWWWTT